MYSISLYQGGFMLEGKINLGNFSCIFKIQFIEVQLTYNVVLISAVSKVICVCVCVCVYSFPLQFIIRQRIQFLCYSVGPGCVSFLNVIVGLCESQTPPPSLTPAPLATTSLLSISFSFNLTQGMLAALWLGCNLLVHFRNIFPVGSILYVNVVQKC